MAVEMSGLKYLSSPRGKNLVSSPILSISLANCLELMPVFDVFCCSKNSNKKSGLFGA